LSSPPSRQNAVVKCGRQNAIHRESANDQAAGSVAGEPNSAAFGHARKIADCGIKLQC
jgi:hypothetical protein